MSVLQLQAQFDALLDAPASVREAMLDDWLVPAAQRALLAAMLARDATELARAGTVDGPERLPGLLQALARHSDPAGRLGARLGAYELVELIGQGGMGAVYRGVRDDGAVRHQAAIKLISQPDPGGRLGARILAERQLLASLEHPGIARFLDAGCDAEGRPWLAMELVQGQPLLDYAAAQQLSVSARLALVLEVCAAVDYAHARLVVHRDLKSSNVLVQADGRTRLLDFGIARSLDAGSAQTGTADRFLSPASAAPEQLLGAPAQVGIDVYALGALLYQLLAGCAPLVLDGLAPAQLQQRILTAVPPVLGASLLARAQTDSDGVAAFARQCGLPSVTALARVLRGDLEQIVARCLRKLPAERYPNVAALASDLQRFLHCEPVSARPLSLSYRCQRFVQRNRSLVLAVSLVIALLSALSLALWQQARQLRDERDAQVRARTQTDRLNEFLVGLFKASNPRATAGIPLQARELLDRALPRLLDTRRADPADADLLLAMAGAYADLGLFAPAEQAWRRAALLRPPTEADPALQQARTGALIAIGQTRYAEAIALSSDALAQAPTAPQSARQPLHRIRASARVGLGDLQAALAELQAARAELGDPGQAHAHLLAELDLAEGHLQVTLGQSQAGLALLLAGLTRRRAELGAQDPGLADTLMEVARAAGALGRTDQARSANLEALQIYQSAFGIHHDAYANALSGLAVLALNEGQWAQAVDGFRQSLQIRAELFGARHVSLAGSHLNLAVALRRQGHPAQALLEVETAQAIAAETLPAEHFNHDLFALERAQVLIDLDRQPEAARALLDLRERFSSSSTPQPRNLARTELALADVCARMGDHRASRQLLALAAPVIEARYPAGDANRLRLAEVRAWLERPPPTTNGADHRGCGFAMQ